MKARSYLLLLGLVLVLVLATASFFYTSSSSNIVITPKSLPTSCEFTAEIGYTEQSLEGARKRCDWTLSGDLEVAPRSNPGGTGYRCRLNTISIAEADGEPLVAFKRGDEESVQYHLNSKLSDEERNSWYEALHVDLSHHDSLNDQSLFAQSVELFIDDAWRLDRFYFSPDLSTAIAESVTDTPLSPYILAFVRNPAALPPLLSMTMATSTGSCLDPLQFRHTVAGSTLRTTGAHRHTGHAERLQRWRIEAEMDQSSGQLKYFELDLELLAERALFNRSRGANLHMVLRLEPR